MNTVQLYSSDGFVAEVTIQYDEEWPDVVVYRDRIYVCGADGKHDVYREAVVSYAAAEAVS